MKQVKRIGFDFDKVFVNYPPLVPSIFINRFYKKRTTGNGEPLYRIPGTFEKYIRVFSHYPLFRHAIKTNIETLAKISQKNLDIYLISSRFSFLKKRTNSWIKKHNIKKFFKEMFFNFGDEQPHLFKNRIINKLHLDIFVDDDLDLLQFLSKKNPHIHFFWIDKPSHSIQNLPKNIQHITTLEDLYKKVFN